MDLMVYNDARFDDVKLVSVYTSDEGIEVSGTAPTARWFDRSRLDEDESPWVDVTNAVFTFTLEIPDAGPRAERAAILERWRDDGEVLEGFSSMEHQAAGLLCRRTHESVACKMPPADLDKA